MKYYVPSRLRQDFENWLRMDVENANYDFQIIRNWYQPGEAQSIRALFFPISWKSKIGNSDANSNFKTSYGCIIRKGDIAIREDGMILMLNWQVQNNPNNQSTQAIACNARFQFERHVDEKVDSKGYLLEEAHDEIIAPEIPGVYAEYTGRPDYAASYNTPGISPDHLLTVQVQFNSRTDQIRLGDELNLMNSRYRIVNRVDSEVDIDRQYGIIN